MRLKEEIDEKIEFFNENASPEAIEKFNNYKNELKDKSNISENVTEDFPQMSKKEQDETIKKLNFYNDAFGTLNGYVSALQTKVDIDPGRLMGLTDGVFSIVMTLLIFGMTLPEAQLLTAGDFSAFIQSILPNIGVTIVSFILIGSFWIYHHQFIKLTSLNMPYLWLNILFLANISFIPFTTTIIGTYSKFFLANVIFGLNIFLTLIFFVLMFRYANHMHFLERELTDIEKKYTYNTFYILMGLTIIVNLLDFNVSPNFFYLFLLVPILSIIRDTGFKIKYNNPNQEQNSKDK